MTTKEQVKATVEAGMVTAGFRPRSGTDYLDMPHLHNDALIDGLYDAIESRHYKSFYDPTAELPVDPVLGDTYIAAITANGWTANYIYEWTGTAWDETVPEEGLLVWIDDENTFYYYNGAAWNEMTGGVSITGAATTIVADNLTANRVAISNGSGKMAASDITTTALSYLDATSSIQTQLNGKEPTLTKGNLTSSGAISLDQTRQVIGGAAAISHVDTAGYKHVPTGGTTGYFLKYGGSSGTSVWAAHGLTASDVGAISGSGTDNYVAKFNGTGAVQSSIIYDNDTNVGIGTTSPTELLHINGAGAPQIRITDDLLSEGRIGIGLNNGAFITLKDAAGTTNVILRSYGNNYFGSGNVGIGTTTPVSRLDVLSTPITGYEERINALLIDSTTYAAGVGGGIGFRGKYNSGGDYNTFGAIKGVKANATSDNKQGILQFQINTGSVLATVMTLTPGGAVGIGTTNPQAAVHITSGYFRDDGLTASRVLVTDASKNHITSSVSTTTLSYLDATSSIQTQLNSRVTSEGNQGYLALFKESTGLVLKNSLLYQYGTYGIGLGIGATAPVGNLEIRDATGPGSITVSGGNTISAIGQEFAALQFRSGGDTSPQSDNDITGKVVSVSESSTGAQAGIAFYTCGLESSSYLSERVRITNSGNVGIGTDVPVCRLDVSDGGITIVGGADDSSTARTSNTTANFRMGSCHYNKSEEPSSVFLASNSVDDNSLRIGGGSTMMNAATNIVFYTANNTTTLAGTERVRIMPDGGIFAFNLASGPAQTDINLDVNAEIIRVTSSSRYKDNIRDFDIDSSVIHKFKICRYDWKDNQAVAKSARGMTDFGFIAEQIAELMPEMANYNTDGTVQSWKTVNMLELAVAEIQRQNGRINALEEHIHQLQEDKNGH